MWNLSNDKFPFLMKGRASIENLIESFEELKKYIFIITRKNKKVIIIKFKNEHFYHLVGLHKINKFDNYFPTNIKSKDKRYKYIKKNLQKFNNILENQTKEKDLLKLRISTFPRIKDILVNHNNVLLYNLKPKTSGSLYNGDFGLLKIYEQDICCLLGLKTVIEKENIIKCNPNSWMASRRTNNIVEFRKPIYMENIIIVPANIFSEETSEIIIPISEKEEIK